MSWKEYLLTDTSPAAASTAPGATIATGLKDCDWFTVDALLLGGTGGVLDVYLQRFVPGLQEWRDWFHFLQLPAGATARYTIDCNEIDATPATPGFGTSPSLAAGVFACASPGDRVRLLFVAGAGMSAGAVQKVVIAGRRMSQ